MLDRAGIAKGLGRQVRRAAALLSARRAAWLRRARAVSARLVDRLPFVYSTSRLLDVVADRWRCQLNENAKTLCHTSLLPEHNHNEIVGMGCPEAVATRTVLLMLFDRGTHPRTARRMEHLLDITRSGYERALRLDAEGESEMERVFSLVMLGDMVSVELARRRGVDPLPVARIDELKRRMQRD
ncbi:hypothetical protein FJY71_02110 [candidate division WOR-3 bacterium]|nr:hypothetical protein [candidate division WOR-3 bacterium]